MDVSVWNNLPRSPINIGESQSSVILTPSQESVIHKSIKLLPEFKILVIKGESGSGKYSVAKEIFKRLNAVVEEFDLCELARITDPELSNQHVVDYLNTLLKRLNARMTGLGKRRFDEIDDKISNLDINPPSADFRSKSRKFPGIIYIRHYNRVADILTDCYSKLRFLLPLILKNFTEKMPLDVRIVITAHGCVLPEGLHWCLTLETTRQDMELILMPYVQNSLISQYEYSQILKISKIVPVGRIIYCLKYAIAMHRSNGINTIDPDNSSRLNDETNSFVEAYRKALSRFSGSVVDVEKDVPNPIPEDELVGVDEILDEITISIINPMKMDIPGIPIKKGMLLCGPPGTGKTSIGRWLAHKIKGKFYSIGGEAGINGPNLVDTFDSTIKKAHENAPAVVFIDDGDVLFDHDDTYRAFLTILDGIETNKRNGVCVILTCMNLRRVPASLIRGGRLEMTLITRLPDRKKIQVILTRALQKMYQTLAKYNLDLANQTLQYMTNDFAGLISNRMAGWNCADIHRCVNDVSRRIIAGKGTNLLELFEHCIRQIREQYTLCGRTESTNLDDSTTDSYIG